MDWLWLSDCFRFVRKRQKISGSDKWAVPRPPGVTQSFQLHIKGQQFLSKLPDFGSSSGWNLGVEGVCIFSIKLCLACWHSKTKNMHSNTPLEKLLRKSCIFFNTQVDFVLSISGRINPSHGKLMTWYCLVKSKFSLESHLESTNNINGWVKNQ